MYMWSMYVCMCVCVTIGHQAKDIHVVQDWTSGDILTWRLAARTYLSWRLSSNQLGSSCCLLWPSTVMDWSVHKQEPFPQGLVKSIGCFARCDHSQIIPFPLDAWSEKTATYGHAPEPGGGLQQPNMICSSLIMVKWWVQRKGKARSFMLATLVACETERSTVLWKVPGNKLSCKSDDWTCWWWTSCWEAKERNWVLEWLSTSTFSWFSMEILTFDLGNGSGKEARQLLSHCYAEQSIDPTSVQR